MAELPGPRHEYVESRNRAVFQALELFSLPDSAVEVRRELREGAAAEEIIARAEEGKFDAVVMPTRGANPLRRILLLGSVTAKVLAAVECPVITGVGLRPDAAGLQLKNVVCAIDLGPATDRILCWGAKLARDFGAAVTVVHATPNVGEAAADFFDESWRATLVARLSDRIEERLRSVNQDARIVIKTGSPPRIVSAVAQESEADMLVIGRGSSNDLLGRLQANAYDIIRLSQCPVISV
jgi:nucleotide-binding universal stress UspA family protein